MIRRAARFFTPIGWIVIATLLALAIVTGCALGVIEADRRAACELYIEREC